jgi:hypothetical protein
MSYDHEKQLRLNAAHRRTPTPGDYWEDHLAPVAVVLAVDEAVVTLCRKTKDVDRDHWTWDLSQVEKVDRDEFDGLFAYESMPEKTWASVHPGQHTDFVDAWKTPNVRAEPPP